MRLALVLIAILAVIGLAACGGDGNDTVSLGGDGVFAVPGNSELVVGPNRFALGLIDEDNEPVLEAPGTTVHFTFVDPEGGEIEMNARFTWAIEDVNGFWTADVEFGRPGQWTVKTILVREGDELAVQNFTVPVHEQSRLPNIGDRAPAVENLTLGTEPNIRKISTDPDPEPALYQMTVAEALDAGRPLVVTFATPAFCQTRFCGPVVDNVKAVREDYAEQVNFIHIEPFALDEEGQLVPGENGSPLVTEPMQQWRLQTEPWIFVIDAQGTIAARFEGAASPEELRAAIEQVLD
jgi:hypothetical protein